MTHLVVRTGTTPLQLARTLSLLVFGCLLPAGLSAHGGFDERIDAANRAVVSQPEDAEARLARAELHRRHGDFPAALRDLDDAQQLAPELRRVDYFRGLVYLDAGRNREAEATLRRFLESQPIHPAGREARARALLRLERPLDAAREYDVVIAQQPVPMPDHYLERARALAATGDAYLAEAIRGIDQGIEQLGPIVTLERVAIDLELRRGSSEAALARLDRITQRSARRETWLAERAEILAELGRTDDAAESYALALSHLQRLSPHKRRAPAMAHLESEIRAGMAALEARERETRTAAAP